MSNSDANAAGRTIQFFVSVRSELAAMEEKIISHANRLVGISRLRNPSQYEAIIIDSSDDLRSFAQRIEVLFPSFKRDLDITTTGFDEKIKSLDLTTSAGALELNSMAQEAHRLTGTARDVAPKVVNFRRAFESIRNSNYDPRLTDAARRGIAVADELLAVFEDLETFGLKVAYFTSQRKAD